jgi:hypothetical protein
MSHAFPLCFNKKILLTSNRASKGKFLNSSHARLNMSGFKSRFAMVKCGVIL